MFSGARESVCIHLFGGVEDVATGNGALLHEVVDLVELRQTDNLEGSLDHATSEEVKSLGGILAVTDVRTLDGDHADDGVEDRSLQVSTGGQTNADDGATRADVLFQSSAAVQQVDQCQWKGLPQRPAGRASQQRRAG